MVSVTTRTALVCISGMVIKGSLVNLTGPKSLGELLPTLATMTFLHSQKSAATGKLVAKQRDAG